MKNNPRNLKTAMFYKKDKEKAVKCTLCPRECRIQEGLKGFCELRQNFNGQLKTLSYGRSTYMSVEPIEMNAVFHFEPGAQTISIGTYGCNLKCKYCQAWKYTRIKHVDFSKLIDLTPEQVVKTAKLHNIKFLSWTFNDPISWYEFVYDTAKLAKKEGILSIFKSSHYLNLEPIKKISKYVDIFSVSIKSFREEFYKQVSSATLKPVLEAAKLIRKLGKHLEVCTLIVPTLNDSFKEIDGLSKWIKKELGSKTPYHLACFHPDYLMTDIRRTSLEDVNRAREIALKNGLEYVYVGNVFKDNSLNTYCHQCHTKLVTRVGVDTRLSSNLVHSSYSKCRRCGSPVPIKFL